MLEEIQKHFEEEYPREGCGVIAIVKGEKKWFPCKNVAEEDNDFVISSNEPSETDINYCNAMGIPYWIYSFPDMELNIVEPKTKSYPLIGREYKFGVKDCFEAMRDYLKSKNIEIPPRVPFEDNWWDKNLDYFSDQIIEKWGGKKVSMSEMKKNDVLIFKVKHDVPDHCGVYIGDNNFFHHAENRLSCREPLSRFWLKYLVGIYRYET